MEDMFKLLYERRSIRKFTDEVISEELKKKIYEAAMMAPTAGNQQLYSIIDVTDQTLKEALAESCDHQQFITSAPMASIFVADPLRWYHAFKLLKDDVRPLGIGDLMLSVSDATIACHQAVLAAESLGIGSCYIGDIYENAEVQRKLLNLPDAIFPVAMVVFGYPASKPSKAPPRFKLEDICFENSYHLQDEIELRKMFKVKKQKALEEWLEAFMKFKYESDFSREMNRSVKVFLESYLKNTNDHVTNKGGKHE